MKRLRPSDVVPTAAYFLYMIALVVTPLAVMLGLTPDLEPALYFTIVVLNLLGAAWTLLWLVFMPRRPASA